MSPRLSSLLLLVSLGLLSSLASCFLRPLLKEQRNLLRKRRIQSGNIFETILYNPLTILGSILAVIPASIPMDIVMQNGYSRISDIANYRFVDREGPLYAYVAQPKTSTTSVKRPVVVLIHQFFGLRERDVQLCEELAANGYLAIAPDCFQGNTTSVIPRAISFVAKAAYEDDWELPLRDLRRLVSHLEATCGEWADFNNIVISGFCFGGGAALRYAELFPDCVKACAVFYGKPIKEFKGFNAKFYGVYGNLDRQFKPIDVDMLESRLLSHLRDKKCIEMRRYPNQAHAFVEDLDCIKRGGDAADAWDGFMKFLERNRPEMEQREWGQVKCIVKFLCYLHTSLSLLLLVSDSYLFLKQLYQYLNYDFFQSYGGCDVCASKLNDDPFGDENKQPDAWEEMKKRVDGLNRRKDLEDSFFSDEKYFILRNKE